MGLTRSNGIQLLRDQQCGRKIIHLDKASAGAHRDELISLGEKNVFVYKCARCKQYHVGHDRLGRQARPAAVDLWAEATRDVRPLS